MSFNRIGHCLDTLKVFNGKTLWLPLLAGLLMAGCSADNFLGQAKLPSGVADPEVIRTPAGAKKHYAGAMSTLPGAYNCLIPVAGLISDELQTSGIGSPLGVYIGGHYTYLDSREIAEGETSSTQCYPQIQSIRTQTRQGIGLLTEYPSEGSENLVGRLRAVEAHAQLLLSELYCSGIPLSTVDYNGDYTLRSASSTEDILRLSLPLVDSALDLMDSNDEFLNFARITKGRLLISLGRYMEAANIVRDVPDDYRYEVRLSGTQQNFARVSGTTWSYIIGNGKGGNGLEYTSSTDERIKTSYLGQSTYGWARYFPDRYTRDGRSPLLVASGIEARLIEAEAALNDNDVSGWLDIINHLRSTGLETPIPDTVDPGTPSARVDLMFYERAAWTFLTGRRLGDMRRLIRNYGRDLADVFPVGSYAGGAGAYGYVTSMPPTPDEYGFNPNYGGCISTSE